jgi:hypothetical protein
LVSGALDGAPEDRFHGGGLDGAASGRATGYVAPPPGSLGRFIGGGGRDGYASVALAGYVPPVPGSQGRFLGSGGYDGWATWTSSGIPNSLSGDADFDQVPDWWEAEQYGSITVADNETDLDGDLVGSFDEYLADTDPNDKASWFRVLGMGRDEGVLRVDVSFSSPNREYLPEVSRDLTSSEWTAASPVPISGNGGTLVMGSAVFWDDRTFARVILSMPRP